MNKPKADTLRQRKENPYQPPKFLHKNLCAKRLRDLDPQAVSGFFS